MIKPGCYLIVSGDGYLLRMREDGQVFAGGVTPGPRTRFCLLAHSDGSVTVRDFEQNTLVASAEEGVSPEGNLTRAENEVYWQWAMTEWPDGSYSFHDFNVHWYAQHGGGIGEPVLVAQPEKQHRSRFRLIPWGERHTYRPPGGTGPFPEPPSGPINSMLIDRRGGRPRFVPLLPAYPPAEQVEYFNNLKNLGLDDVDLYVGWNRGDNPFNEPHHFIDIMRPGHQQMVVECIERARASGLRVTGWCFADDFGGRGSVSTEQAQQYLRAMVPPIDDLVSRYVIALEGEETFSPEPQIKFHLVPTLRGLTDHKIYAHWRGGENFGTTIDVDGLYYQYNARTPDGVRAETNSMIGKWHDQRKEFIAAEFYWALPYSTSQALRQTVKPLTDGVADG